MAREERGKQKPRTSVSRGVNPSSYTDVIGTKAEIHYTCPPRSAISVMAPRLTQS